MHPDDIAADLQRMENRDFIAREQREERERHRDWREVREVERVSDDFWPDDGLEPLERMSVTGDPGGDY